MTKMDENRLENFVKEVSNKEEKNKIETLFPLTLSTTPTGIANKREKFAGAFLENIASYLQTKHGREQLEIMKELSQFLTTLRNETGLLLQRTYQKKTRVRDELNKLKDILLEDENCKDMLKKELEEHFKKLSKKEKEIIKYRVVFEKLKSESDFREVREIDWKKKAEEEFGEVPMGEDFRELKFRSGLFISKTKIDGSSPWNTHHKTSRIDDFEFLKSYFQKEFLSPNKRKSIEDEIKQVVEEREKEEEKERRKERKKKAEWGTGAIKEEREKRKRKKEIKSFVEYLSSSKEYSKIDVLWSLALTSTNMTRGHRGETGSGGITEWLGRLGKRNIELRHEKVIGEGKVKNLLNGIDDKISGVFMEKDYYDKDIEILKNALSEKTGDYLKHFFEEKWKEATEKDKKIIQVVLTYLKETGENVLKVSPGVGSYNKIKFYDDMRKISLFLEREYGFKLDHQKFHEEIKKSSMPFKEKMPIKWFVFELADRLVELGMMFYSSNLTGKRGEIEKAKVEVVMPELLWPSVEEKDMDLRDSTIIEKVREVKERSVSELAKERDVLIRARELNEDEFEELVQELLMLEDYENVKKTTPDSRQSDFGIDIVAEKEGKRIGVQAKNWRNKVRSSDVRDFIGSREHPKFGKMDKMIFITTSDFTKKAKGRVQSKPFLESWDADKLREKLRKHREQLRT